MTTRTIRRVRFLLPLGAAFLFALSTNIITYAQANTYTVQPGDNLYRIALRFNTDVNTLAQINGISNTWRIYTGQTLTLPGGEAPITDVVPAEAAAIEAAPMVAEAAPEGVQQTIPTPILHTVTYGEHLASIAALYGLTTDQLATMNDILNPNLVYIGQELTVGYESSTPAASAEPAPAETVTEAITDPALAPAESPLLLAASPTELVNGVAAAPVAAQAEARHTVQPGEALGQIAARYGVSMAAIAQANNIYNADTIYVGQTLVIPATAAPNVPSLAPGLSPFTLDYGLMALEPAPPAPLGIGREILVDLSDFRTYAYQDGVLVRNVLISPGMPETPTVQGDFTIQRQYAAQTMAGPGYYLPDVPYVSYFYQGYAFHGTYWHSNWGQPMSHGCVNMPIAEAEWLYYFVEIGTPVRVQA